MISGKAEYRIGDLELTLHLPPFLVSFSLVGEEKDFSIRILKHFQ